jgi:ketosteroid isomerase-like protein
VKQLTILSLVTALLVLFMAERAAGQGSCPNGMCSLLSRMPVESRVHSPQELGPLEKKIVEIEKNALEKWYAGDPSAYIAMMDPEIGYFEPILEKRLDGKDQLTKMYEALRGKVHAEKFDMLNTRVQATDNMAVLSCNLLSIEGGIPFRWNCTEVFALNKAGQWKLIHSHWSQTKPQQSCR